MANLSDVAKVAGVSISAVSRVLSNAPSARVSDETRQRIHEAARELDYRPNFAARALKFSRTNVVALVVPDLTNAIFTELMRGVEEEAQAHGYMVLLARAEGMPPGEESIPRLVGEGRVDGVLVQVGDNMREEDLTTLLGGRVPAVLINSTHRGHVGSVALEDERAARVAVGHLVGLGHTRIGLLNGVPEADTAVRRGIGFRAAMAEAGLRVEEGLVTTLGYEPRQGREALRELAASHARPTAVVVANVNAALGALLEARVLGIRVPEELSIVAIHDAWTAETTWPPLTTVRMPLYELGRNAMRAIYELITQGKVEDITVTDPPPELIVRGSTAPPRST
jgi:LacI family transcriptional regulator